MANQIPEASLDAIWNPKLAILQTLVNGQRPSVPSIAVEPLSSPSEPFNGMSGDSLFIDNRNSTYSPSKLTASNQAAQALMQRGQQEALIRQLAHSEGGMESNPAWRQLMALNPKAGGAMFQADTGMSYDDARQAKMQAALKTRNDLATFPRETIQSMISGGKLRQTGEGQWLQEVESEDELGKKIKNWVPANETVMNLLQKAGGASGVGITELGDSVSKARNMLLAQGADPAMVDEHLKAKLAALQPKTQPSPEGEGVQQGDPLQKKGLIPEFLMSMRRDPQALFAQETEAKARNLGMEEAITRIPKNILTQLIGGRLQEPKNLVSAPSNELESLNALRLQQGVGPLSQAQYINARGKGQTNKELLQQIQYEPQLDTGTLMQAIQAFVDSQLRLQ